MAYVNSSPSVEFPGFDIEISKSIPFGIVYMNEMWSIINPLGSINIINWELMTEYWIERRACISLHVFVLVGLCASWVNAREQVWL